MSKFYVRKILSRIIVARNALMSVYQIRSVFTKIMKVLATCFHQPSSRITNYIFFFFCSRFFKLIHAHTFSNYSSFNPPSFHSICAISTFFSTYSILSLYLSIFLPKYLDFVWLLTTITIIINK